MEAVKKTFGVVHLALAAAFGVQFVASPLYDSVTVWLVLDWFVAVGVVTGVVFSYLRWTNARQSDHGERIGSGVMLIGSVAVFLMFFEQWFTTRLFPLENEEWVEDRINLWWQVVTVAFVLVSTQIGAHLLGIGGRSENRIFPVNHTLGRNLENVYTHSRTATDCVDIARMSGRVKPRPEGDLW